jgi:phosphoglycolate phosphatase-like HAD superfamily hydrolase
VRATTVLWDIDGTLVNSGGVAARAFLDAVAAVTGQRPPPGRRDYGGRLHPEIAAMLLAAVGAAAGRAPEVLAVLERLVAARVNELRAQTFTYPGVDTLLASLTRAGLRQTVVTGNVAAVARHKLEAARLIPPRSNQNSADTATAGRTGPPSPGWRWAAWARPAGSRTQGRSGSWETPRAAGEALTRPPSPWYGTRGPLLSGRPG